MTNFLSRFKLLVSKVSSNRPLTPEIYTVTYSVSSETYVKHKIICDKIRQGGGFPYSDILVKKEIR